MLPGEKHKWRDALASSIKTGQDSNMFFCVRYNPVWFGLLVPMVPKLSQLFLEGLTVIHHNSRSELVCWKVH